MMGCNKKKPIRSLAKKRFGPIELTVIEIEKNKAHAIWVQCELPCHLPHHSSCHLLCHMCHVIIHVLLFDSICYDDLASSLHQ